jgi:hypothetical protein
MWEFLFDLVVSIIDILSESASDIDIDLPDVSVDLDPGVDLDPDIGFDSSVDLDPGINASVTGSTDVTQALPANDLPPQATYLPYSDPNVLQSIADSQGSLPICGLETIENMVQIHCPGVSNALSDQCIASGWLDVNGHLPMERYQPLLQSINVPSQWINANDFQTMLSITSQPGGSIGLYGDAFYLDSIYQKNPLDHTANPTKYFHAITLEEPWVNGQGETIGFIG